MLLLAQDRDWNQRELADALEIEHPSVVRLLDGLEKQELIRRVPVEGDRRAKRIELTTEGQEQVRELQDVTHHIRAELLEKIDRQSLENALFVLQEVTRTAEFALVPQDS
jgi:MarR family transcriptional regulator for hemolysin